MARRSLKNYLIAGGVLSLLLASASAAGQSAIPDFSGRWGRTAFNFEPPETGPKPLSNLRRVGEDAARPIEVGDPVPLVGDYMNPILTPEAAAVVKQRGEFSAAGHDFPDPSNQCGAYSPPYLFTIQLGMQLLQSKDEVLIVYNQDDQARHVRLNASHPRDLKPTLAGDSVGHYEGDTLVVDTVGIRLQYYTTADRFGTPQSEAMHVIERYRLIDASEAEHAMQQQMETNGYVCGGGRNCAGQFDHSFMNGLRVEVRIEDPKVYTTPWIGNVTYMHLRRNWAESVCSENNTDVLHQGFEHAPTAARPDF